MKYDAGDRYLTGATVDRRDSIRYPLRVPVVFSWDRSGGRSPHHGFTRDLSTRGIHIVCEGPDCPPVNATVVVRLGLPRLSAQAAAMELDGRGRVVRHTGAPEEHGFAVATENLVVVDAPET